MLFDFSGERRVDETPRISQPPEINPVEFEQAKRPDNMQYPKPASQIYQPDDNSEQGGGEQVKNEPIAEEAAPKPETPAPGLNNSGMLAGWVIQVGAFKEYERADKLVNSLLADGYKAYQMENRNRGLFFVYVGPEVDKSSLLTVQKKIDGKYRVKSKILVFEA